MLSISKFFLIFATIFLPFDFLKLAYNFSFIDLAYFLSFVFIIIYHIKNEKRIDKVLANNVFLIPLIIYSIGFFISFHNAFDPADSLYAYFQILFIFIIIYYAFSLNTFSQSILKKVLYFLAVIIGFVMCVVFLFFLTGIDYSSGLLLVEKGWGMIRFSYGDLEPNITARIIIQSLPILFIITIKRNNWIIKIFNLLLILLLLATLILTASRSGIVVFLIGILLFFIFYFRYSNYYNLVNRSIYLIVFLIGAMAIYNAFPEFFENSVNRYSTIFNPLESQSSKERILVLEKSIENINKNPFIGYGLGNSHNITGVAAHNSLVISWLENGVFGFLGFALIYILIIYYILIGYNNKFYHNDALLALAVMSAMMIVGDMFMANSYKRVVWVPTILFIVYSRQLYSSMLK